MDLIFSAAMRTLVVQFWVSYHFGYAATTYRFSTFTTFSLRGPVDIGIADITPLHICEKVEIHSQRRQ
jgi:hypothetical protein